MAFIHVNASTQTTPAVLFQVSKNARPGTTVSIYNGHSASIFVGNSTISTSGATIGRTIAAASSQAFDVSANDIIYAISAAASAAGAIVITYSA